MPVPIVYEVLPSGGGWLVRMASDSQVEAYPDKISAVARARQLAARENAAVRVLEANGRLEEEFAPPGSRAGT